MGTLEETAARSKRACTPVIGSHRKKAREHRRADRIRPETRRDNRSPNTHRR